MNERLTRLRDAVMRREGRKVEVDENGRVREVPSTQRPQDEPEPRGTRLSKRTFGTSKGRATQRQSAEESSAARQAAE